MLLCVDVWEIQQCRSWSSHLPNWMYAQLLFEINAAATFRPTTIRDIFRMSFTILWLQALVALSSLWDEFIRNISTVDFEVNQNIIPNTDSQDIQQEVLRMYNMCLTWDSDCNFIFDSWETSTKGGLVIGIILSFLFAFLSVSWNFLKQLVLTGSRIKITLAFLINYIIKLIVMFLLMTMNAWVCGFVILGIALGQLLFMYIAKVKKWKKSSSDDNLLKEETSSQQVKPQ